MSKACKKEKNLENWSESDETPANEWARKQLIAIIDLRQWPGSWGEGTPISKSRVEKKHQQFICVYARGVFLHNFFYHLCERFFFFFCGFFCSLSKYHAQFLFFFLLHLMLCTIYVHVVLCFLFFIFSHWLWCLCRFLFFVFILTRSLMNHILYVWAVDWGGREEREEKNILAFFLWSQHFCVMWKKIRNFLLFRNDNVDYDYCLVMNEMFHFHCLPFVEFFFYCASWVYCKIVNTIHSNDPITRVKDFSFKFKDWL